MFESKPYCYSNAYRIKTAKDILLRFLPAYQNKQVIMKIHIRIKKKKDIIQEYEEEI